MLSAVFLLLLVPCISRAPALEAPPSPAERTEVSVGGRISGKVDLSGRIRVTEDLLIPAGAALVLRPGTVLVFVKSESSKVDPEYFYGGTELVVRGRLLAEGAEFRFPGRTGGVVVDGGDAALSGCKVSGAEGGISVLHHGRVSARGSILVTDCRVGVALFPGRLPAWEGEGEVTLEGNAVGAVRFPGAPEIPGTFRPGKNEESDVISWTRDGAASAEGKGFPSPAPARGAVRIGDTFLDRDRTFSGDVIVDGVIRVAPGATLTVEPGSRVFFTYRDTDGDGIGENGIFLQGNLSARGTKEKPIGFYPFPPGGRGRWDAINFMVSETGENVLEHVEIVGGYRGLHAHFSRFSGKQVRIADCYRGIQFQESKVDLTGIEIVSSASALRCRDSDVRISGYRTRETVFGSNFLRSAVRIEAVDVDSPGWYGFRFRESRVEASDGAVRNALVGVSAQEGEVRADRFRTGSAGLAGFSWQDGDVTMTRCRASGSVLDGVSATGGKVAMAGGAISGFGRYAVKLGGPADVALRGVEVSDAKEKGASPIYDGRVAPGLGIVKVE
jgi:hypothetical protein